MSEVVVLDAVSVATIARAARNLAGGARDEAARSGVELLPPPVAEALAMRAEPALPPPACEALRRYAETLDEIAEAAVALDQHEHEIEHQLRWWSERVERLQSELTGHPADDVDVVRELALYRGRMSGAQTMRRHYAEQRNALVIRHRSADTACAVALAES